MDSGWRIYFLHKCQQYFQFPFPFSLPSFTKSNATIELCIYQVPPMPAMPILEVIAARQPPVSNDCVPVSSLRL